MNGCKVHTTFAAFKEIVNWKSNNPYLMVNFDVSSLLIDILLDETINCIMKLSLDFRIIVLFTLLKTLSCVWRSPLFIFLALQYHVYLDTSSCLHLHSWICFSKYFVILLYIIDHIFCQRIILVVQPFAKRLRTEN